MLELYLEKFTFYLNVFLLIEKCYLFVCLYILFGIIQNIIRGTQFQNPVIKVSVTPLHKIYNYILM